MTNTTSQPPNHYLTDASALFRAARLHRDEIGSESVVASVLLYAVGIERVLKAILHAVNPVYVYQDAAFKHTVSAVYLERILPASRKSPELAEKPNHDVITFREALRRAAVFSHATQHNSSTLYKLSAARDVIAHCRLSLLDEKDTFVLAYVLGPQLVTAYENELGMPDGSLDGRNEQNPRERRERAAAEEKLNNRIASHRHRWEALKEDLEHARQAQKKAGILKGQARNSTFFEDYECPACGNVAVLTGEVDYDWVDGEAMPQGTFPIRLECPFCDLTVDEAYELDQLGTGDYLYTLTAPGL
jgi:hypothetical protein